VVLVVCTVLAMTVPGVKETPVRIVLGLPYVLFVPGYALIAALFPEGSERPGDQDTEATDSEPAADIERQGIDGIERVALSFGLSIAVVPLVGLVLNFTTWGIRLLPIIVSGSTLTCFSPRSLHTGEVAGAGGTVQDTVPCAACAGPERTLRPRIPNRRHAERTACDKYSACGRKHRVRGRGPKTGRAIY
jgi:hypothetical protein